MESNMEGSREPRIKRRLTCRLDIDSRRHHGIVLSVSLKGLFVPTRAAPPRISQDVVTVRMSLPEVPEVLILETRLVRWYQVPSRLIMLAGGGLALTIRKAPDAWRNFVAAKGLVPVKVDIRTLLDRFKPSTE